jgi:hypothetical protein
MIPFLGHEGFHKLAKSVDFAAGRWRGAWAWASVYSGSSISIPAGTVVVIRPFQVLFRGQSDMVDMTNGTITLPEGGLWAVGGLLVLNAAGDSNHQRIMLIIRIRSFDGTFVVSGRTDFSLVSSITLPASYNAGVLRITGSWILPLPMGSILTLEAFTSGGTVSTFEALPGSAAPSITCPCSLWAWKLA